MKCVFFTLSLSELLLTQFDSWMSSVSALALISWMLEPVIMMFASSAYMMKWIAESMLGRSLIYLIGINLPGRNLPIFEKGGKFLPGNLATWASYGEEAEEEELDFDDDDDRDLVIPLIHNHDDII